MTNPLPADSALRFFRDEVEPTVAEFMGDCASKRRAGLACVAVASMTDHYFHAHPELPLRTVGQFRWEIRSENWAVGAVADIANASKHFLRGKSGNQWGYEDLEVFQLNTCGIKRCGWPLGGHEVLAGPDRAWRVSTLLSAAMNF